MLNASTGEGVILSALRRGAFTNSNSLQYQQAWMDWDLGENSGAATHLSLQQESEVVFFTSSCTYAET